MPHRWLRVSFIAVFLNQAIDISNAKEQSSECPLGFTFVDSEPDFCYYLHPNPVNFIEPRDMYENCAGNIFTKELYDSIDTKATFRVWAEYKMINPGGYFLDWSLGDNSGRELPYQKVNIDSSLEIDQLLCTVIEPDGSLAAVTCDEKYRRYCFVKPYDKTNDNTSCGNDTELTRFSSPRPTCLKSIDFEKEPMLANYTYSETLCAKYNSSIVHRGWRYSNFLNLETSSSANAVLPLAIAMDESKALTWLIEEDDNDQVAPSEFDTSQLYYNDKQTRAGISLKPELYFNDDAYGFIAVVCEKSIHLNAVLLTIIIRNDNKIILKTNETSDNDLNETIKCFNDDDVSGIHKVKFNSYSNTDFVLETGGDGYYWCINTDSENYVVSESKKVLYVKDKKKLKNRYTIKFRAKSKYTFQTPTRMKNTWKEQLNNFIYLTSRYLQKHNESEYVTEDTLKKFKTETKIEYKKAIDDWVFKRLFMDRLSVIVHVSSDHSIERIYNKTWEGLTVEYVKPVYYCNESGIGPVALGESIVQNCTKYECVGDFIEGVNFIIRSGECESTTTEKEPANVTPETPTTATVRSTNILLDLHGKESGDNNDRVTLTTLTSTESNMFTSELTSYEPVYTQTSAVVTVTAENTEVVTVTTPDMTTTVKVTTVNDIYISSPPPPPTTDSSEEDTDVPCETPDTVENVLNDMDELINSSQGPVPYQEAESIFGRVDVLLGNQNATNITSEFLRLLDTLGSQIELNDTFPTASIVNDNLAVMVADASRVPIRGLIISATGEDVFSETQFEFISNDTFFDSVSSDSHDAVVHLPANMHNQRVSFIVFRTESAFSRGTNATGFDVNSKVLSITLENVTHFVDNEFIDIQFRPVLSDHGRNQTRGCAFWDYIDENTGQWSQEGCIFIPANSAYGLDTCRCYHLTHFAEILVPRTLFSDANEAALEIISIVGAFFSIFGVVIIILTACFFRSWRRNFTNKVWLQLCISILILAICFLIVAFVSFQLSDVLCMLVGIAMHYSVLSSFCWMLVSAILSYRRLVLIFTRDGSHKLLKASAFSWGFPFAVVGILLSVNPQSYGGRFDELNPGAAFCYPSGLGLYITVYAPIAVILLVNWTLFGLIFYAVTNRRNIQRHGDTESEALKCAKVSCVLVFVFGLPWIFGLFATELVFAYFFTLTATFQGFILFVLFVVATSKTRDLWLNKLKIKQTQNIPVTHSTSRSEGAGWKTPNMISSPSQIIKTRPKSLNTPDNSVFS